MNEITNGTRVRSTESQFTQLTTGTYRGFENGYHLIEWDNLSNVGDFLHFRAEFEVIE